MGGTTTTTTTRRRSNNRPSLAVTVAMVAAVVVCSALSGHGLRRGICYMSGIGSSQGVASGTVQFDQAETGNGATTITLSLKGLGPGQKRGMHLHQYGDISDSYAGMYTRGHFAVGSGSDSAKHGNPSDQNPRPHNGDLGNVVADTTGEYVGASQGSPSLYVTLDGGVSSVVGRAAVVHQKNDTYDRTTDTGNAGGRYAQCVIGIANTELSDNGSPNTAAATPVPTGSYASCQLQPLVDSTLIPNPATPGALPNGTLQLTNDVYGRLQIASRITGLAADTSYTLQPHRYGDLGSVATLGPVTTPAATAPLLSFASNCRGALLSSASADGQVFSLNDMLGRSLALHYTDPVSSDDKILAACVVGLVDPAVYTGHSVLKPLSATPRAHCKFAPTDKGTGLQFKIKGSVSINATDEFDCAASVSIDVKGLNTTDGHHHGFHIHTYGDLLDTSAASRTAGHFNPTNAPHALYPAPGHVGDLPNLVPVAGAVKTTVVTADTRLRLSGPTSVLGRSFVIHQNPDDGVTQPAGNSGTRIAQCVIGRSDYRSQTEVSGDIPNDAIGQDYAGASHGTALFENTLASPPVTGSIQFLTNATTGETFAHVVASGGADTLYQFRVYTHGTRTDDGANIAGDANFLRVLAIPPAAGSAQPTERDTFLSDSNGNIDVLIGPLLASPNNATASKVKIPSWIGRTVAAHPVRDGTVYPATASSIIGVANPAPVDNSGGGGSNPSQRPYSPPVPKDPASSSSSIFDSPLNTGLIAGGIAVGASVVGAASVVAIKKRKAGSSSQEAGSSMRPV